MYWYCLSDLHTEMSFFTYYIQGQTLFSISWTVMLCFFFFFFQAEDGIRDSSVTGVQTCALPISRHACKPPRAATFFSTIAAAESLACEGVSPPAAVSETANASDIQTASDFRKIGRASCRERV